MRTEKLVTVAVLGLLAVLAFCPSVAAQDDTDLQDDGGRDREDAAQTTELLAVSASSAALTSFIGSLSMIIASEIGDKTFFIAAILGMRHPHVIVLTGALGALIVMTILSAVLGWALPALISKTYTHYASILLFLIFGLKLLKEGWEMPSGTTSEELEEVEMELRETDDEAPAEAKSPGTSPRRKSADKKSGLGSHPFLLRFFHPIVIQAFTMTFLGEWGDRSQIATIAMAASQDALFVTLGAIVGHSICTTGAVFGGKMLASRISEKSVNLSGGILFLIFAVHSWYTGPI